jgi:hypothetical protein
MEEGSGCGFAEHGDIWIHRIRALSGSLLQASKADRTLRFERTIILDLAQHLALPHNPRDAIQETMSSPKEIADSLPEDDVSYLPYALLGEP